MKRAHIVLTNPSFEHTKGVLNGSLAEITKKELESRGYVVSLTKTQDKYDIAKEQNNWKESELIVFHFPLWWMSVPNLLKKYMDEVYGYGVFFQFSETYGRGGGLMNGKRYVVAVTLNAQKEAFDKRYFFGENNIDDVLRGFHFSHKFCGLEHMATYKVNNAIHGDNSYVPAEYTQFLKTSVK